MSVKDNLERIRDRIAKAAIRAGRSPDSVRLVAVSKMQPIEKIEEAYNAGQRDFGENYAQELRDKASELARLPDLRFHFLGTLQKNKAKYVVPVAHMFQALDDLELAHELDKRASAAKKVLPVLVEVNCEEEQKGGVREEGLDVFLESMRAMRALSVEGLMCIPPATGDARPHFKRLAELAKERGLSTLSMGMSSDFEAAIEEGATLVRVGTAIFGERPLRG